MKNRTIAAKSVNQTRLFPRGVPFAGYRNLPDLTLEEL